MCKEGLIDFECARRCGGDVGCRVVAEHPPPPDDGAQMGGKRASARSDSCLHAMLCLRADGRRVAEDERAVVLGLRWVSGKRLHGAVEIHAV